MLLFLGEISCKQQHPTIRPELHPIQQIHWKKAQNSSAVIHYCDFSPLKNRIIDNNHISIGISGNPVIDKYNNQLPKCLSSISDELRIGRHELLESANGVFCGFHFDKTNSRIQLFTDYLGLRQIFIQQSEDRVVFSNAQWLMEEALDKNSQFDEQAIIEMGVLGYPLGNRTRWKSVSLLPPGQMLTFGKDGLFVTNQLSRLTSTKPQNLTTEERLETLDLTWHNAVQNRLDDSTKPMAFLSGGMDSRLLVNTLKACNTSPRTANFAPRNTMDRVFAELAAKNIGVPIWFHPTGDLNIDFVTDTVNAWRASENNSSSDSFNRTIWSGDGGSVGLGHVYLDDEITQYARRSEFLTCAQHFCTVNKRRPVARAYTLTDVEEKFEHWIKMSMEEYSATQPERAPYYFLMLNDQRRHLDKHYETYHKRNFDFSLPFFDRRLIEFVASLPPTDFNQHRMYDKLFRKIGGALIESPWQTYPGHVACGIPAPEKLEYQWGSNFYSKAEKRRRSRREAWASLRFAAAPTSGQKLFNKPFIALSSIATLCGITDRSYLYECIYPMMKK